MKKKQKREKYKNVKIDKNNNNNKKVLAAAGPLNPFKVEANTI